MILWIFLQARTLPTTTNLTISYLPVGTPVEDVDIRFPCTDHTFTGDVNVIVFSPSGTQVPHYLK